MMAIKGMGAVQTRLRQPTCWLVVLVAAVSVPLLVPTRAVAYTPTSPEVREMLARAMSFLSTSAKMGQAARLGGQCLIGLAEYKYNARFGDRNVMPPMTEYALGEARAKADRLAGEDNYSVGIATIMLCEVHPEENLQFIRMYLSEIYRRQKPHGGWGYEGRTTGDLSQLQYPVLALWAARNAGLEVDNKVMADVVNYVLRVQDPSGAWGYQGNDPGTFTRVPQTELKRSLTAAGLGSLYVGADFLGMSKTGKPRTISASAAQLPPALIPVASVEERRADRAAASLVKSDYLRAAMNDGNEWIRKLPSLDSLQYQYYFLYGIERCNSFREKVEGTIEEEPKWYNEGVRVLREKQHREGSWGVAKPQGQPDTGCDPPVATAFAMLFLLRSTQGTITASIDRDGILRGGYGLPNDLTEVRMRNNKIVAPAITGEVEDLIGMLEDEEGEKIENLLENPDSLSLSGLQGSGTEYTQRLVRILCTGSYKSRIVAARALGRQGSLDNVPILIYALTDPDERVMKEARDGLRLISRKFDGFGLPDKPTPGELGSVVSQWKAWYKSVRPDAVFLQ